MGNDFRIKKINAKEEVEFHNKGISIGNSMISSDIWHKYYE